MARAINDNDRHKFRRKDADRSFIRQVHIYTEGSVTEPEYLQIIREIIKSNRSSRSFRINVKSSKSKSSPKNIRRSIREDIKYFGDKKFNA